MNAFITGGSGFIGTNLAKALVDHGNEVTVFDVKESSSPLLEGIKESGAYHFIKGDVRDGSQLRDSFREDFDVVFHLAGIVGVKRYLADPFKVIDVNLIGLRNMSELALEAGTRLVFASTSEIYGKNPKTPWKEDDDRLLGSTSVDRWVYSSSKAVGEHMLFALHRNQGLPVSVVRFFNAYGPSQEPVNVVPLSICRVLSKQQPLIYDDGTMVRCFTHIDDLVTGTIAAGENPRALGEAFNIGSDRPTSIVDLIDKIVELAGEKGRIDAKRIDTKKDLGEGYEDIPLRIPDVAKAERLLGFRADVSLKDGLERTISWYARNKAWWRPLLS